MPPLQTLFIWLLYSVPVSCQMRDSPPPGLLQPYSEKKAGTE